LNSGRAAPVGCMIACSTNARAAAIGPSSDWPREFCSSGHSLSRPALQLMGCCRDGPKPDASPELDFNLSGASASFEKGQPLRCWQRLDQMIDSKPEAPAVMVEGDRKRNTHDKKHG